jgi:flagellar protein FlbD
MGFSLLDAVICGPAPVARPYVTTLGSCSRFGTVASGPYFGLGHVDFTGTHFVSHPRHSVQFCFAFFNFLRQRPINGTKEKAMIELTRLNGRTMVLNSDLIKTAETSPDTMLTLINGEKLIVRETIPEVEERVLAYRARLLAVVSKRLHNFGDLERVAALASLDVTGQNDAAASPPPGSAKR